MWLVDRTLSPFSWSVISGLPQSSLLTCIPQFPLLREPSTAVVQVCCGTVICSRLVAHVLVYLLTHRLPSIETPHLHISEPLLAAQGHNSTRTAVIFVCVNSFIQALTAKHRMLSAIRHMLTRSRYTHNGSGHSRSSYVSVWLLQQERLSNSGGLRWWPHLVPIVHTSH